MTNILPLFIGLLYIATAFNIDAQESLPPKNLQCRFKLMAAKDTTCFLFKTKKISSIKSVKLKDHRRNRLSLNSQSKQSTYKEHDLFSLEFSWKEDNLTVSLHPKMFDEYHTMANITYDKLSKTQSDNYTYQMRLFFPIQLPINEEKNMYVHGIEIGPCKEI